MDSLPAAADIPPPTSALAKTIVVLYAEFASYKAKRRMDACEICIGQSDHRRIHAKPLRKLASDILTTFAHNAVHHWGNATDLKHFLPRMLELAVLEPHDWEYSFHSILSALHLADWDTWPESERDAIHAYFIEYWRYILRQEAFEWWVDVYHNYLHDIAGAVDDLTPYLSILESERTENGRLRLAQLVHIELEEMEKPIKVGSPFWQREAQRKQLHDWLLKPELEDALQEAWATYSARPKSGLEATQAMFQELWEIRETANRPASSLHSNPSGGDSPSPQEQ